eukprot:gene8007-10851_t
MSSEINENYVPQTDEAAISGYLYKKTRDGRWQKRWFETNGMYLTYYKSKKMEKLLAALSLPQVGEIKVVPASQDPEKNQGLFSLELNTRIYVLRAKNDEEAENWVKTLIALRNDGLAASIQQARAESEQTQGGPGDKSNIDGIEKPTDTQSAPNKAVWIKAGKSCFGCC